MKNLIVILLSLGFAACSTTGTSDIVAQPVKIVQVKIPDSLLASCVPQRPIDKQSYMALTLDERELALSKYILSLYGTIAVCNKQLNNIKTLNNGGVNHENKPSH